MEVKRLSGFWIVLFITAPTLGHDTALSPDILKKLFPQADAFVERQKRLTLQEILQVEQASGDKVQEVDQQLTLSVALVIDDQTNKIRSIGAVLMVDASSPEGTVDLVVAYNLDGSVKKVLVPANEAVGLSNSEPFWKQLEGKSPSDGWNPEEDFELGGDSVRARAVIRAVRRGMYLFLAFQND